MVTPVTSLLPPLLPLELLPLFGSSRTVRCGVSDIDVGSALVSFHNVMLGSSLLPHLLDAPETA
jgi:hypothetical protein